MVQVVGVEQGQLLQLCQVFNFQLSAFQCRKTRFVEFADRPADMWLCHPQGVGNIGLGQRKIACPVADQTDRPKPQEQLALQQLY